MIKRVALVCALLIVGALFSFTPAPVDAQEYDWSYTFRFSGTDYCFNFIEGSWDSGFGLLSNGASPSVLQANWQYFQDVYPAYVEVRMSRVLYNTADLNLAGIFHVFGIQSTFNTTITGGQEINLAMPASAPGLHSNSINLAVQTDAVLGLIVSEIRVFGNGASPFGEEFSSSDPRYTNCEGAAPTNTPFATATSGPSPTPPATATFTPIPTLPSTGTPPTPTQTLTPSITYTPSPTGTCAPFVGEEEFDFTVDDYDYVNVAFNGTWTGGQGFLQGTGVTFDGSTNGYRGSWYIPIDIPGTITRIEVDENNNHAPISTGFSLQTDTGSVLWSGGDASSASDKDFTGLSVEGAERFYFSMGNITTWGTGYAFLSATITYQISCEGLPTPTPSVTLTPSLTPTFNLTASPTPAPTNTLPPLQLSQPSPDWCYQFDFRTSLYDWLITNGFRDAQGLSSPTSALDNLTITSPNAGSAAYRRVVITFNTPFAGRAPNVMLGSDYTFSTIYTIRQTSSTVPITLVIPFAGIDEFALDIDRDRFNTGGPQFFGPLRLQKIATYGTGTNPFGADNCAPQPTSTRQIIPTLLSPMPFTPIPSGTPLATYTLVATQTFVPTSVSTPTMTATRDNLGIVNPAFVPWGSNPSDAGVDIGGGVSDLLSTGQNAVTFGENLIGQAGGYLNTLTTAANLIGSGWNNAVPTELPGLPKCSTQRFASELCAIYYILTFTVFAGPIGSLIIPIATFAVFFWIFLAFVKLVVNILETLAKLQRVS